MVRLAAILMLIVGLGIGSWLDRSVEEPPREIGGYQVVEADFHVHSFLGDGVLSPFNLVLEAKRRGLHAFALTNHNQVIAARLARWFSRRIDGPIVLVGQEITAPGYHFVAAGLGRTVSWRQSASDAIRNVHEQGGVVIAAHPVASFWPALDEVISSLDGAEVMHPLVYFEEQSTREIREFFSRAKRMNPDLAAIGSSDFHALQSFGVCRTLVFVENLDETGVLQAIRDGRTVVFDETGQAHGNNELIRLLDESKLPESPKRSTPISIAGALAWIGLAGWVFLGARGSKE